MSEKKHALLNASRAKRWLTCTPSARLEETLPEEKSEYAEEGSFAHKVAEVELRFKLKQIDGRAYKKQRGEIKENPLYTVALEEYIQSYVTIVMERVAEARTRCKDPIILLEQKLDFSRWVPEGFGTGDVIIIADGILEVIDLKYGKGAPVSAEDNPQIRLYGLGALEQFDGLYDIETVKMTIVQPRLDSVSSDSISVSDLYAWAENVVTPKAIQAMAGEGEYVPGDHCQFCRAKATCRARANANLELAKYDFTEPALLTDEEIADILTKAEQLQSWAGDIRSYALDQAENHGKKWPGWKLVEGRSNRVYSDKQAVAGTLLLLGYDEEIIFDKEIKGITAMEKVLGKKNFEELLGDLIIKPAGRPTLVLESDPRPEINSVQSAIADFADKLN